MEIVQTHSFDPAEARARVAALADYLRNRHGVQDTWSGESEVFLRGKYAAFSLEATVQVEAGQVRVTGKDPSLALRAAAKAYVGRKLAKYLDPSLPLAELPRG